MPRRWLAAVVLAVVGTVAVTTSTGLAAGTAPGAAATRVVRLSPVNAQGAVATGLTIRHRFGDANCESGSPTVGKAYECFTPQSGQGVFHSCWVQTDHHFVVCLVEPWLHKVARLHVTRGYGKGPGFHRVHPPWGVQIGNRVRCLVILGPTDTTRGHRVTYSCNHKEVLAGRIHRGGETWHAHSYRKVHHGHHLTYKSTGVRPIAVAWFGKPSETA